MQWLPNNIPAGDAEGLSTTITHGDFRLENLIFAPDSLEIQAVLDWNYRLWVIRLLILAIIVLSIICRRVLMDSQALRDSIFDSWEYQMKNLC